MRNRTVPGGRRTPGAKMTIRVYKVSSEGEKSVPRATVTVPYSHKPVPTPMSTALPPCACPIHRKAGAVR
ncbi:hypothetical protein ACIBJF_32935 [Streptomyces sp. NPDC050743]|uniref:hypothetical protein n=1 Tax=Streptomyces sp. NPDC050743 TaxID=3365634 RepID=UPI0037A268EE